MSEGEKRKQEGGEAVYGGQKKARETEETVVTDDEVEEFYAILRRINTAVKYFKSGNDHVVGGESSQSRWRATVEQEIRQEVNAESRRKEVEVDGSLDLNVSPPSE